MITNKTINSKPQPTIKNNKAIIKNHKTNIQNKKNT